MTVDRSSRLVLASVLLTSGLAPAATHAAADGDKVPHDDDSAGTPDTGSSVTGSSVAGIVVTGIRSLTRDKIPDGVFNTAQTIDIIPRKLLQQQATTRLEEALKNVPGITLNAGEGASRGDTVNLRGFPAFNDFFLDGIRDAAIYNRDSFDLEAIEVLKGPSAVLFGRGSTGGAINQVSKAPTLAPLWSGTVVGGTNDLVRATADVDQPIGANAAIRLNAMAETSEVADRDNVRNRRWGLAPSFAIGIGGPDTFTASYLHQQENNVPDTGQPFIDGRPADVPRNLDYGLTSDRFTSNVNIGTARYRHEFSSGVAIAGTLRYADYRYLDSNNAPNFGYDNSPGAPTPGEPLSDVLVGRDSPSNYGHRTNLTGQIDLDAHFTTGPVSHTLVAGLEYGREHDNVVRLHNPFGDDDETPPTPLLDPDPNEVAAPQPGETQTRTTAYSAAAYVIDTVHIGSHLDITGGVRFDRFSAHYRPTELIPGDPGDDETSPVPLDHVDNVVSPRGAIVYKPNDHARFYFSFGTSFDPSAEALSLNVANADLGPVKAKSYEVGAKLDWMGGRLVTTGAVFRTEVDNAQTTDPDHPERLILAGDERVDGIEIGATGHLTDRWEITAGYTHLDGKTIRSTTPEIVGKQLANLAPDAVNLWTEYDATNRIEVGVGGNYLSQRFADFGEAAVLPSFVIVNAMASYKINDHLSLRINVNNLLDKRAYGGSYYSDDEENHVIPLPGRTVLFTAAVRY